MIIFTIDHFRVPLGLSLKTSLSSTSLLWESVRTNYHDKDVALRPRPHISGDFVSANFFMRIHLASTRVRRIRSVYPEISVCALQSGNFCIRCVSGYVWTLVPVYFCISSLHSIRTSLAGSAFFVMRMLCWLILWDVRIRIGYVWTVVYDSYTLRVDADIFVTA